MPLVVNKQEKASQIAESAMKVFMKQGFHQTKMADIAVAANVGKGTLYEYFRNKNDILKLVYNEHLKLFDSDRMATILNQPKPSDRLFALINVLIDHMKEWESIGVIFIDYYSLARADDEFLDLLTQVYESMSSQFSDLIRESQTCGEIRPDIDSQSAAKVIMCFFDGLILYGSIAKQETDINLHTTTFLKMFRESMGIQK